MRRRVAGLVGTGVVVFAVGLGAACSSTVDESSSSGGGGSGCDPNEPVEQVAGDCKQRICTDDGTLVEEPLDGDVPADVTCDSAYACQDGELVTTAFAPGDPCEVDGWGGACVLDADGALYCEPGCGPVDNCPPSANPCIEYVCNPEVGMCEPVELDDVPSPNDAAGDCLTHLCVQGQEQVVPDDTDLPADESCTMGTCSDGVPGYEPRPLGYACSGGPDQEVCDGAGSCVECNDVSTCEQLPADSDCSYRECVNNQCLYTHRPDGYPLADPVVGDCRQLACDGNGSSHPVNDDSDLPIDGNVCTSDLCTNGVPSNPPCCAGQSCGGTGVCGSGPSGGVCIF